MTAESKLDNAEFLFNEMKKHSPKTLEFRRYFAPFLMELFSVWDHLLYDYAAKYRLGISYQDWINVNVFEQRACQLQNQAAIQFINWYSKGRTRLSSDKIMKALIENRNIEDHRATMPFVSYQDRGIGLDVRLPETPLTKDRRHESEKLRSIESQPTPEELVYRKFEAELTNLGKIDVFDALQKGFELMRNFVREAHQKFP